tara:strand:+ start:495 stop:689 length:195 start_codon:yes stop_codon:yes gene_type:complete
MGSVLEIEKKLYPAGVDNYAMFFGYNLPEIDVHFQRSIESIKLIYEKNISWFSAVSINLLSRSY